MALILLLTLIIVSKCDGSSVVGRAGEDITLSCKYDINYYGALAVCWGRGQLPRSGCNNQLFSTDGYKVIEGTRTSSKYQLLGPLDEGNVSLTILNVSETDAGRYGCKVYIPGWFNGDKQHHDLKVEKVLLTTTSTTLGRETSTEQPAASSTSGQAASTELPLTSSSCSITAEEDSSLNVVLVCVLFELGALVIAGAIIIISGNTTQLKNPQQQQQFNSTVEFIWTSSPLNLQSRGSAVKNIYQTNGGVDGSEYEYCTSVTYYYSKE